MPPIPLYNTNKKKNKERREGERYLKLDIILLYFISYIINTLT